MILSAHHHHSNENIVDWEQQNYDQLEEIVEEAGRRSCNRCSTERVDIARKSYEKDKQTHKTKPTLWLVIIFWGDSVTYHKNCCGVYYCVLLCIK